MTTERCVDLEPLHSAWLDGMLDERDTGRLRTHLDGCPECRREVDSLARTRALVRGLPVRRLPDGLRTPGRPRRARRPATHGGPGAGAGSGVPAPPGGVGALTRPRLRQRVLAGVVVGLGLVGGAAFALGGESAPGERVVPVPIDLFVADHLVHTVGGPVSTPAVVDGRQ